MRRSGNLLVAIQSTSGTGFDELSEIRKMKLTKELSIRAPKAEGTEKDEILQRG